MRISDEELGFESRRKMGRETEGGGEGRTVGGRRSTSGALEHGDTALVEGVVEESHEVGLDRVGIEGESRKFAPRPLRRLAHFYPLPLLFAPVPLK